MEKRDFSAVAKAGYDLAQKAGELGTSSAFLTSDLAGALFPKSEIFLSDRLLSNCQQYLRSMVGEIESGLCLKATEDCGIAHASLAEIGNSGSIYSYESLSAAGLLTDDGLLKHVFAQAQKTELINRLLQKISQEELENSLAKHLDNDDKSVAEAAMALLVSSNRSGFQLGQIRCRLEDVPVEILHSLTWSVTAAVRKITDYKEPELLDAAQRLLDEHDESKSIDNRAQRLAGLLDHGDQKDTIPHPIKDGLDLFMARIALRSGLSVEQVITFTAEPNMARMAVVMRALGIPNGEAIAIFTALDGNGNLLTSASYSEISQEDAAAMVGNWSSQAAFLNAELALSSIKFGASD